MFSLVGFMGLIRKNTMGGQNKKSFKSFVCEIFGYLSVLLTESARKTFMNFLVAFKMVKQRQEKQELKLEEAKQPVLV